MVCAPRLHPHRALVTRYGPREKFSPPPASAIREWPLRICSAAVMMAWAPDPHARETLSPQLSTGMPACSAITRLAK